MNAPVIKKSDLAIKKVDLNTTKIAKYCGNVVVIVSKGYNGSKKVISTYVGIGTLRKENSALLIENGLMLNIVPSKLEDEISHSLFGMNVVLENPSQSILVPEYKRNFPLLQDCYVFQHLQQGHYVINQIRKNEPVNLN